MYSLRDSSMKAAYTGASGNTVRRPHGSAAKLLPHLLRCGASCGAPQILVGIATDIHCAAGLGRMSQLASEWKMQGICEKNQWPHNNLHCFVTLQIRAHQACSRFPNGSTSNALPYQHATGFRAFSTKPPHDQSHLNKENSVSTLSVLIYCSTSTLIQWISI